MPQAVAHILFVLILVSLFRDKLFRKKKKSFPIYYVLIAGLGGVLPDFDVLAYWILYFFGFSFQEVHRTFMHTLFLPLVFFFLYLAFILYPEKIKIAKQTLNFSTIFLMISFGSFIHLFLDFIFYGKIMPFYPLFNTGFGLNIFGLLPEGLSELAAPSLDAGLLIIWLMYLEIKHKISDFV